MNFIEKQMKLQRELAELNSTTWQRMGETLSQGMTQYTELNQEFANKLPPFGDVSAWMQVQREYGEASWTAFQTYLSSQGEILKEAMDESNELIRTAWADVAAEAPAAV